MISKILVILVSFSGLFCMEKEIDAPRSILIKNFSPESITAVYISMPEKNISKIGGVVQPVESRQIILPKGQLVIKTPNNIENIKSLTLERDSLLFGISSDARLGKSSDYASGLKEILAKGEFNPELVIQEQKEPIGRFAYPVSLNREKGTSFIVERRAKPFKHIIELLVTQFPLLQKKIGAQRLGLDTCMLIDAVDIIPIAKGAKANDIDQVRNRIMNELKQQFDQKNIPDEMYKKVTELVQKAFVAVKAKVLLDGYPAFWKDPFSKILYEGFAWKSRATMEKDFKDATNLFREYLFENCK